MSDATAIPATPPAGRPRRRRGLLWPLLLIVVGGFFLASNLGYVGPVPIRTVLQLWPLLLVLSGIEVLLARREPILALAIEVLVVAVAVGLVVTQPRGLFVPVGGAQPSSAAAVPRQGATSLALRVEGSAGTYSVSGGASDLVEARSDHGELTVRDSRRDGGQAAEIRVQPATIGDIHIFGTTPPTNVDVRVARDVPTSLRVEGGAGDFIVDLRDIQVRDARIETGASHVELTLPKPSGEVPIRIQAGAANVVIVVPGDVEVRITTSGAILSTTTLNPRIVASGTSSSNVRGSPSSVETPGYAAAKDRVTITIEAGASSITIR
jgi:hypothetical protein